MKRFFIAFLVVGGITQWWMRQPAAVPVASLPPTATVEAPASERDAPVQRSVSGTAAFELNGLQVMPLAEYGITARVLSAKRYHADRESKLSPLDLALGWGSMSRKSVIDRLSISQSGRWYHWRYSGDPPIPHREIERSSANVHIVPASTDVARRLSDVDAGSVVSLRGYLVEARGRDGWSWRSSLTRDDTGAGACEVMLVMAVDVHR